MSPRGLHQLHPLMTHYNLYSETCLLKHFNHLWHVGGHEQCTSSSESQTQPSNGESSSGHHEQASEFLTVALSLLIQRGGHNYGGELSQESLKLKNKASIAS